MYLIDITKTADNAEFADFAFSASEAENAGALRLIKATGEIRLLRPISGGRIGDPSMGAWRDAERYFDRAARKVRLAWRQGTLPDSMTWAS